MEITSASPATSAFAKQRPDSPKSWLAETVFFWQCVVVMSTAEILNELPRLKREDRRAIARRVFELDDEREELEWAAQAADAAFQELDKLEEGHAPPKPR